MHRSLRMLIAGWLMFSPQAFSKAEAWRPVPEYAPTSSVLLSADLFSASYHAPELILAITRAGADVVVATNAAQTRRQLAGALLSQGVEREAISKVFGMFLPHGNIWLRDYGAIAIAAETAANHIASLANFRYEDPASRLNNQFPMHQAKALGLPLTSLPLILDGGNFLAAGDYCFTSVQDRSITNEVEVAAQLTKLGCRRTMIMADAPHAHLDMWVKVVNDHQLLVNQIDDAALSAAVRYYGHLPTEIIKLRDALDRKAAELTKVIDVQRLPMPLPYRGSFRTYSNAILVNGHAIVPKYRQFGWNYDTYPDASLQARYENRVKKVYEKMGFQVSMINADGLIFNGGAFHCVTLPLPYTGAELALKQKN